MEVDAFLFAGWMMVPLVAYVGGRCLIGRTRHKMGRLPTFDPERRLEELRRRVAEGRRTPRGRMAEAVWLAESAHASPPLRARQP